jgi:predicted Rossmann fold flavoprotein
MPKLADAELFALVQKRFKEYAHGKTANEALIGLFNKKMIDVLLKESEINLHQPADELTNKQIQRLCQKIKQFRVDVIGSKGVDVAQVCAGGVDTSEINADTLESKIAEGVYFAGEVLDIDGTCGGYNLQWAWSSGYVAGVHAAEKGIHRS